MTNDTPAAGEPLFNFGRLQIEEATAKIPLPWVAPGVALVCRPAHESNRAYQSAMLATAGKRQRLTDALAGALSQANAKQDRDEDRKLFPGLVVVNWEGVTNTKGEPVAPTPDNIAAFLRALPDWLFDRVRIFAMRPENFVRAEETPPNASTLAGN